MPSVSATSTADPTGGARAVLPQFLQRAYCNAGRSFSSNPTTTNNNNHMDNNNNTPKNKKSEAEALSSVCAAADTFACGVHSSDNSKVEHDDEDNDCDDEDDIRVSVPPEQHQQKQQQPQRGVRSFVDGFLSPFMNCVQPPLQACTAPVTDWPEQQDSRTTRIRFNVCSGNHHVDGSGSGSQREILQRKSTDVFSGISVAKTTTATTTRTTPRDNDILCGRGNNSNRHQGNQQFRDLIAANKAVYSTLTKKEKMSMAKQIVNLLLHHTDPPARFLGRDTNTGLWYDIGLPRSLEKTSQALREKTAAVRAAEKQASSTASGYTPPDPSDDTESDVFSNISEPVGVEVDYGSRNRASSMANIAAKSRTVDLSSVKIPAHLQQVFAHHQSQNHNPPKRHERQQTVGTRTALLESPHGHGHVHPYALPHPQHLSARRTVDAARQRSAPLAPTYDYAYEEYPFDERRLAQQQQQQQHSYGHHHHPYYADPHFAVHIPPPPPPPPMVARTSRSMTMTMTTPPHLTRLHPSQQQQQQQLRHTQPRPSSAIVTPQHPYSRPRTSSLDHPQQPPSPGNFYTREGEKQQLRLHRLPQTASTPTRRGGTSRAASDFPDDVFQNPEWSSPPVKSPEHERPAVESKEALSTQQQLTNDTKGIINGPSPTLEQEWKRQRISSMRRVDVSSSTATGGDTSIDTPLIQNLGTRHGFNNTDRHNNTSFTSTTSSSTGLITEAIETQLTLEERVISSPSALNQSYASRRRRSVLEALPRPAKMSNDLNLSADSMDGMAALATAAFLRLDESDD